MPVLQEAQNIFGYVPLDVQEKIADGLGTTLSEVYGVATFYSQFSLEPKGQYVVGVCLGTACYVKGSQKVLDKLSEELRIPVGNTGHEFYYYDMATQEIDYEANREALQAFLLESYTVRGVDDADDWDW